MAVVSSVLSAIANFVAYWFSERRMKAKDQAERERIADEVARGDEDAVNARLGRRFPLFPWILWSVLVIAGCFSSRKPVYVRESDKVIALPPGAVHTNENETVEWILPRALMLRVLQQCEGL